MVHLTLDEYLNRLRNYDDIKKLHEELRVQDNYPVLLYGNQEELFHKVTEAFRNSPQEDGIRDLWQNARILEHNFQTFDYSNGAVTIQVQKGIHGQFCEDNDKVNGLEHSVWIMFHSQPERDENNVWYVKAMALAIASFGEYLIRQKMNFRLPWINLNHIPV